jgi:hypothetical protein
MNEIITFGKNYTLSPGIKLFVKSAKKCCDKLTVIGSNLNSDLITFLQQHEVNFVDAETISTKYNVKASLSPYTLKVIFFYLYCKHYSESKNVYLCDFTDLYFQKSPFDLIDGNKVYVTSENQIISKCETNTTWIRLCYNDDIYRLISNNNIINGGNIFGNRMSCLECLNEMCSDIAQIISKIGNYPNVDQASLNKVVYFDLYRYNVLTKLQIANMAHLANSDIKIVPNKGVEINGIFPYVIHQYDVVKQLENYLYVTQ